MSIIGSQWLECLWSIAEVCKRMQPCQDFCDERTPAKNSARDLIPAVFAKSNVPKIPKAFV